MEFRLKGVSPLRSDSRQGLTSSTTAGRLNFSASSSAHCLRSEAGQKTSRRRLRSAQYWQSTIPASMVLPKPTSSASKTPFDNGDFNRDFPLGSIRVRKLGLEMHG